MICSSCGHDNRAGARFCLGCGSALSARCPACEAELPGDARFCDSCGATLASEPAAPPAPAADARKVVTVLFADLAGSTQAQDEADPETVRRLMDAFYGAMRSAVEHHGGRVVKFMGDGVMAVFGIPEVAEDDAWRAVGAAVTMQASFGELAPAFLASFGRDVALRIGVNTGEVVVHGGDDDVVGDAVNVASRLEAAAGAGEVVVGDETWRLTRQHAGFEALGQLSLRGKAVPVAAYRLVSLGGSERESEIPAPFVGRQRELARLCAALDEAVTAGAARLVSVIGSPGLGKSRLIAQFEVTLGDRAQVLEARCPQEPAATFAPVAEALRTAVGAEEASDPAAVAAALAALLPDDDADRARVAPSLQSLLGAGAGGSLEELFWATRRVVAALARERPVVLVLDDAHWAEPLLLDLVEHLAEWTQDAPLLVVVLARPELRESRPSLVEAGRFCAVLALEGLAAEESEQLACDLLKAQELPKSLLDRVLASSEGNPLFVRELLRMLVDDGVLRHDGSDWVLAIDADAVSVPPTIQSLLAARIERLPAGERVVLECASVVGRHFYRGAVAELLPVGAVASLDANLESLRRKELIEPEGTYWIDERVLRFHHVLLRDAAYRRLLKEVRAELHERVAGWLERKAGDRLADHEELVGYHLEQALAYRRQVGRRDESTQQLGRVAAGHLGAAGRRALGRDDLTAAAAFFGRAIGCLDAGDPVRSELLVDRCESLLGDGDLVAAAKSIAELEGAAAGWPRLAAWSVTFAGQLATLTEPERLPETAALVSEAAAELGALGDPAGAAKAHSVHALALARLGHVAACEAALDRALAAAREAGDRRRATAVLAGAPLAALWGPSPVTRASGRCLDVVRVLRITTSAPAVEATSLRCQAVLEALRGRADAARRMLSSARRSLEALGHAQGLLDIELFAGLVELYAGDAAAAEARLRAAYEGFVGRGVGVDAAQAAALLARACLAQGRVDEALDLTLQSERLGGVDLKSAIAWRATRAEALALKGSGDEALELARAAVALADQTDALIDQADAHLSLAVVLRSGGRLADAESAARRAHDLYERKGATARVADVEQLISQAPAVPGEAEPEHRTAARWLRPNAAMVADEALSRALEAGRIDDAVAALAEDFVDVDYRTQLTSDRDGALFTFQEFMVTNSVRVDAEALATLGDRHLLSRIALHLEGVPVGLDVSTTGSVEVVALEITRTDVSGCIARWERFHPGDLHLALARLVELHAEDELPAERRPGRYVLAEQLRAVMPQWTEDAVVLDHRPAGLGTIQGREAIRGAERALTDVGGDIHRRITAVVGMTERVTLLESVMEGRTEAGEPFEISRLFLGVSGDDGFARRVEWYPPEQVDDALARFQALAEPPAEFVPDNAAVAASRRLWAWVCVGDWDAVAAATAEDWVVEDRRRLFARSSEGPDSIMANLQAIAAVGLKAVVGTPIATRGDRLVLMRDMFVGTAADAGASEVEVLGLYELDTDGRVLGGCVFDVDDLDAAFDELDARFLAGEASPFAQTWTVGTRYVAACNAREWAALGALFTEDCSLVDHRPNSFGTITGVEMVEAYRAMSELAPDFQFRIVAVPRLNSRGVACVARWTGKDAAGGDFDITFSTLGLLEGGRLCFLESFPIEDLDVAMARIDGLTEPASTEWWLDNAALRSERRLLDLMLARDWEAFVEGTAEDAVLDGRRHLLQHRLEGRDAVVAASQATADAGTAEVVAISLATRGDRLVLSHNFYRGRTKDGDASEVELLNVHELDGEGRWIGGCTFDFDDLDAAFDELDARYLAGEASSFGLQWAITSELFAACNRRDWETCERLLGDGFRFIDHRLASFGTVDRATFIAGWRASAELAPDLVLRVAAVLRTTAHGLVCVPQWSGNDATGGEVEISFVGVGFVQDGHLELEAYPFEELDTALARLDALDDAPAGDFILDNDAVRTMRHLGECLLARDWAAYAAAVAGDVRHEDRRPLLGGGVDGRDAFVASMQVVAAMGVEDLEVTPIATRAECLALTRQLYRGRTEGGDVVEVEVVMVAEVDGISRYLSGCSFDPGDLDAALAELDERFIAEAGPGASLLAAAFDAVNDRDWDRFVSMFSPDAVYVDHRMASAGELDRAGYMAWVESLVDLAPDARFVALAVPRMDDSGSLTLVGVSGTNSGGGSFDLWFWLVTVVDGGLIQRVEAFPSEAGDAALATWHELVPTRLGGP